MKTYTDMVLFSGGLDSAVTLAICQSKGYQPVLFFCNHHFRSTSKEMQAIRQLSKFYSADILSSAIFFSPFLSHLLRDKDTFVYYSLAKNKKQAHAPFIVPYRNFIFMSLALSYCGFVNAKKLWLGFDYRKEKGCSRDKSTLFTDCFQKAIKAGGELNQQVKLITPLQGYKKAQTIQLGLKYKVPFDLTWSCYNNFKYSCGICNACVERLKAFRLLDLKDPLRYLTEAELLKEAGKNAVKIYESIWKK